MSKLESMERFISSELEHELMHKHVQSCSIGKILHDSFDILGKVTIAENSTEESADFNIDATIGNDFIITIYYAKCRAEGLVFITEYSISRG